VASEEGDPDSLLNFVRSLIAFRKQHPALWPTSAFVPIYALPNKYPFIFARSDGEETLVVVINPSRETKTVTIRGEIKTPYSLALGSGTIITSMGGSGKASFGVGGRSFSVYILDKTPTIVK